MFQRRTPFPFISRLSALSKPVEIVALFARELQLHLPEKTNRIKVITPKGSENRGWEISVFRWKREMCMLCLLREE